MYDKKTQHLKTETTDSNLMPRKAKTHISLTIDSGLIEWIDLNVKDFTFQSRSHAIEQAVHRLKKEMEKNRE